ncbi:MAG: folate-binding protein YgfZ [Deltaproteobacteria bacterium]|nr:folate-binding protein YgfZ [Deltaproteobacteria bacterium]
MSAAADRADAVRRGAGLFALDHRGVVHVGGGDALRWLNGMITADVAALEPDTEGAHVHALLLTPIGRIIAELHVVARPDGFWLELQRDVLGEVIARLEKYVIADDVTLRDVSDAWRRLGLEGPAADAILDAARPALDAAGAVTARFGWSGERSVQLFVPAAALEGVRSALAEAGRERSLVDAGADTLDVLRIESGRPRQGAELDEEVLPPEARLDDCVSTTKGCYTGQEVIARIASRGQVKHLLVGLRLEAGELPPIGTPIQVEGRRVGEVTSVTHSNPAGAIALGYVQRPHDQAGTAVDVEGRVARVAALPFVTGAL